MIVLNRRKWLLALLFALSVILLLGFLPEKKNIYLKNFGSVRIAKASFFRSIFPEASCKIDYTSPDGRAGSIELWQSICTGPITVIVESDPNVLLCLYDYDVAYLLLRIDTGKPFKPLPDKDTILKSILFTCTWEIQGENNGIQDGKGIDQIGTDADWQEMLDYLYRVQPETFARQSVTIGVRKQTPQSLIKLLEHQHVLTLMTPKPLPAKDTAGTDGNGDVGR